MMKAAMFNCSPERIEQKMSGQGGEFILIEYRDNWPDPEIHYPQRSHRTDDAGRHLCVGPAFHQRRIFPVHDYFLHFHPTPPIWAMKWSALFRRSGRASIPFDLETGLSLIPLPVVPSMDSAPAPVAQTATTSSASAWWVSETERKKKRSTAAEENSAV